MDPSIHFMDNLNMAFATNLGPLDDCDQSAFPSSEPRFISDAINTANAISVYSLATAQQMMASNSFSFPSNDLAAVTWDMASSKMHMQPHQQQAAIINPGSSMDFTPELSPAMSLCTPAVHALRSPLSFDVLGLDELGSSPSIGWHSPLDDAFGSQQSQESFEFDFGVPQNHAWATQSDFQLFPDSASVESLQRLLMDPIPVKTECEMAVITESPFESDLDYFSPRDSVAASPTMDDYSDLFGGHNPALDESGHGECSYKPSHRHRRRRITSEEESRVIVGDAGEDAGSRSRYKCSVCDKTFSRPFNLRSHRATHGGVKPFTCSHVDEKGEVCNWSFARRHDLERHTRSRHSTEKQFKCKTCGSECGRADAFKRHLQRHPACGLAATMEQQRQEQECQAMDQAGA